MDLCGEMPMFSPDQNFLKSNHMDFCMVLRFLLLSAMTLHTEATGICFKTLVAPRRVQPSLVFTALGIRDLHCVGLHPLPSWSSRAPPV